MVPVSHLSISGSSMAQMGPCIPPSSQATAPFHLVLMSWGKGEGDDLEDMAECLALHVLQLPYWHFPCVRNKNVNKEQVIKPASEWKWQEFLDARGLSTACSCCPWAVGHWDRACCSSPPLHGHKTTCTINQPTWGSPVQQGTETLDTWDAQGLEHVAFEKKPGFQVPGKTSLPSFRQSRGCPSR